jgi:hypothetical protein
VVGGVDADLGQRLEHLLVDGRAGVRAGRARLVAAVCSLPEQPFRHHGPAAIGHTDEEDLAHSGWAIVANETRFSINRSREG